MGAHIRLVSPEAEERAGLDGEAIAVDEAPVGLPEEAGADKGRPAESRRDEMLGEAAPPLVAEPEDRAGGPGGRERPKDALARLIAFARPRKAKAAAAIMEAGSAEAEPESETALGKREDEDAGSRHDCRPGQPGRRRSRTEQKWASGARSQQWLRPNPGGLSLRAKARSRSSSRRGSRRRRS